MEMFEKRTIVLYEEDPGDQDRKTKSSKEKNPGETRGKVDEGRVKKQKGTDI